VLSEDEYDDEEYEDVAEGAIFTTDRAIPDTASLVLA